MDESHQDQAKSKLMATKRKRILVRTRQKTSNKLKWTGFSGKMLWDWMQLLIIPFILAVGGFWFTAQQNQTSLRISQQQYQTDLQIAQDQEQETTLKTYLDDMSDLLLNHNLLTSKTGDDTRAIARARTLSTLNRLNGVRKGVVIQFLYQAGLISRNHRIVDLSGADLSKVNLGGYKLNGIDLSDTDLSNADLSSGDFSGADLSEAFLDSAFLQEIQLDKSNLSNAYLSQADLVGANLNGANLSGADLSFASLYSSNPIYTIGTTENEGHQITIITSLRGANLTSAKLEFADLSGADLRKADLRKADLTGTDLQDANLDNATIENSQLTEAKSLKGTTMPNGLKHP